MEACNDNNTWELCNLPQGRRAVGCKRVFKENAMVMEKSSDERQDWWQGFSQKYGVDYDEVFTPVARNATFRLMLSVAGIRKLVVKQYDIKTAFLNGNLDEEIYMKQPPGWKQS